MRPTAVGICGSDFHFFEGLLSEHAGGSGFPRIQGHEVGAVVEAVGPGVKDGIEAGGQLFSDAGTWHRILDTNLWGVVNGIHAFAPAMIEAAAPGAIVVTGSKQGITTPPGNTPYNVSKAGVKVVTEALAHDLRRRADGRVTAHLLIPGFVYTGLTRARGVATKPEGAWTPEETVAFLLAGLARGDFYILCPDNETTREQDEKRIAWAAGDLIENRPALSRWHPDFSEAFKAFMAG